MNPNPTSQQSPITDSGRGKGPNLDPGRNKGPALGQNQVPNTFITKFYTYILDIHFYMYYMHVASGMQHLVNEIVNPNPDPIAVDPNSDLN